VVLAVAASTSVLGEDDFSIIGTYTRDQPCKADGSNPADGLVKITREDIESNMGFCSILHTERDGSTIQAQVACRVPGGQVILGDVTFKMRDDKTVDFDDQDHTSPATLYRCVK
jgi:hypothetical protein